MIVGLILLVAFTGMFCIGISFFLDKDEVVYIHSPQKKYRVTASDFDLDDDPEDAGVIFPEDHDSDSFSVQL